MKQPNELKTCCICFRKGFGNMNFMGGFHALHKLQKISCKQINELLRFVGQGSTILFCFYFFLFLYLFFIFLHRIWICRSYIRHEFSHPSRVDSIATPHTWCIYYLIHVFIEGIFFLSANFAKVSILVRNIWKYILKSMNFDLISFEQLFSVSNFLWQKIHLSNSVYLLSLLHYNIWWTFFLSANFTKISFWSEL